MLFLSHQEPPGDFFPAELGVFGRGCRSGEHKVLGMGSTLCARLQGACCPPTEK